MLSFIHDTKMGKIISVKTDSLDGEDFHFATFWYYSAFYCFIFSLSGLIFFELREDGLSNWHHHGGCGCVTYPHG